MIPDAPVTKFVMTLRGAKQGPIQNSEDVCEASGESTLRFQAHNNLGIRGHLGLEVPCGGRKAKAGAKHKAKGRGR